MNLMPMFVWKLIEILLEFPRIWSGLGKWLLVSVEPDPPSFDRLALEGSLNMEGKRNAIDLFVQGKVGFRNIIKVHWKLTSGSPLIFSSMSGSVKPVPFSIPSQTSYFSILTVQFFSP